LTSLSKPRFTLLLYLREIIQINKQFTQSTNYLGRKEGAWGGGAERERKRERIFSFQEDQVLFSSIRERRRKGRGGGEGEGEGEGEVKFLEFKAYISNIRKRVERMIEVEMSTQH
jgi:hypothetical protein